jgi:hypothetical protein
LDLYLNSHGLRDAFAALLLVDRLHIDVRRHEDRGIAALIHKVLAVCVQTGLLEILLRWVVDSDISFRLLRFLMNNGVEDMGVLFLQLLKHFWSMLRLCQTALLQLY